MNSTILIQEIRGAYQDTVIRGDIAVVGEKGLECFVGDPKKQTFYRSAAKPIQILPFITLGLHEDYRISHKQLALIAASHMGEPEQVKELVDMLRKVSLCEEDLILAEAYPHSRAEKQKLLASGAPKRKIYHNCSGKHIAMCCISRKLGEPLTSYPSIHSKMGLISLQYISAFCGLDAPLIGTAIDGCGVPIFRVPLENMAISYLRLANPELLEDEKICRATSCIATAFHAAPDMVRGKNTLCQAINSDPNLFGKLGAGGVYCIGFTKQKRGIAIKMEDGNLTYLPLVVKRILQQLSYQNPALFTALDALCQATVYNDSGTAVGEVVCDFTLSY